jgi:hypothetical protein
VENASVERSVHGFDLRMTRHVIVLRHSEPFASETPQAIQNVGARMTAEEFDPDTLDVDVSVVEPGERLRTPERLLSVNSKKRAPDLVSS